MTPSESHAQTAREIAGSGTFSADHPGCAVHHFGTLRRAIEAALLATDIRAREEATAAGWQDISTAPKDGTTVMGYWAGLGVYGDVNRLGLTRWHEGEWVQHDDEDQRYAYPTHWRPLPALPTPPAAIRSGGDDV